VGLRCKNWKLNFSEESLCELSTRLQYPALIITTVRHYKK
jgi:hypothetical protein